jgi:C-terminal processing protease CtpA/Prc
MKYISILFILLIFISCNSGKKSLGDIPQPMECTSMTKKEFVYAVMHDSYLWADKTPVLTKEQISKVKSDEELLDILKQPKDRYSFILDKKEHDDYFESGVNKGFGYFPSQIIDANNTVMINIDFVYPDSPASRLGLKRGDHIVKFDGLSFEEIKKSDRLINKYFGASKEDLTVHIELSDKREYNISKEEFDIKTILHRSIINKDDLKIGYLVYQSFIGTSKDELDRAFAYFKENSIDELILDLRYNGGGFVYLANYLGTLIGGDRVSGTVFNRYRYNEKYSKYNEKEDFQKSPKEALGLSRVFIITTDSSCSASELVINSLKSSTNSVEVIQIGKPTCGKPYAMTSMEYCDKYLLPIQMESLNGDFEGGFIDGIAPTCLSADDISRDFGDLNEDSLANALYYIKNNNCKVKFSRSLKERSNKESIIDGFKGMYGIF